MMESGKVRFLADIAELMQLYGQKLTPLAGQVWWNACAAHEMRNVRQAILQWCANPDTGKWAPKPADIAGMLQKGAAAAGEEEAPRIAGNEAWGIAVEAQDEGQTVVWTNEIADAFDCAQPVFREGDKIGARMAFLDAYARIVATNKKAGIAPQVLISRGWEHEKYLIALQKPLARFLLAQDQNLRHALLPAPDAQPEEEKTNMPQWFADWLKNSKEKWARKEEEAQAQKHAALLRERQDWQARKRSAQQLAQQAGHEKIA